MDGCMCRILLVCHSHMVRTVQSWTKSAHRCHIYPALCVVVLDWGVYSVFSMSPKKMELNLFFVSKMWNTIFGRYVRDWRHNLKILWETSNDVRTILRHIQILPRITRIYHWKKFWFGNMTASLHRHSKLLCYIRSRCCVHLRMHIAQSHTAGEQPTTCIVHHPHVSTVQCALSAALRTHTCWAERNERMIETHTQTHRQKAHSSIYRVSVWRMWRTYTWRAACCLYVKRIITPSIEPSNEW